MDAATYQEFKLKFVKLTLVLNVLVLMYAGAIVAYFLLKGYNIPVAAALLIAAVLLTVYFKKAYERDKAWLSAQQVEQGG
ncbi:MAG: hypothetical protein GKC04_08825 [Methanomicrobiales archaeon]|nr:hypothetical protein [Methanomicrobiales archaeon]